MRDGTIDLCLGGAMLAIAGRLIWETTSADFAQVAIGHEFGPAFFPRIVLGIWAAAALVIAVRGMRDRGGTAPPQRLGRLGGFAALTAAYVALIGAVGFLLASIPFNLASMLYLGLRRPLPIAIAGVGFPLAAWYVFNDLIGIPLPASPWFERF